MTRRIAFALVAAAPLAFAAACGGGGGSDTLTLEEFFAQVQALDDKFDQDSDPLQTSLEDLSDAEVLEQAPDIFSQQADNVEAFIDGLDALKAPEEAKQLQADAVRTGRDAHAALGELVDSLRSAATVDDLNAAFQNQDLNAAFARFDAVCHEAETLAADNNITIDLNCEEQ